MSVLEKDNHGGWMAKKIKEKGFTYQEVVHYLPISYPNFHSKWLKKPDLDWHKMKQIADVITYDLRDDYPQTAFLYQDEVVNVDFKEKYYSLLEKHMYLQEEFAEYKAKHK
jgi:hypothetical protein